MQSIWEMGWKAEALNPYKETRLYNLFSQVSSQIHVMHFNQGSPFQHVSLQIWFQPEHTAYIRL